MLYADTLVIRGAVCNDAEQIYNLILETLRDSHLPFTIYQDPRSVRYLMDSIKGTDWSFKVAVSNGDIVGYAQFGMSEQTWFLNYIAVKEEYRGHGIGRRLFEGFESEGKSRKCRRFGLDVFEADGGVTEWYLSRGYSVERRACHVLLSIPREPCHERVLQCDNKQLRRAKDEIARTGFTRILCSTNNRPMLVGLIGEETCKLLQHSEKTWEEAVHAIRCFYAGERNCLILTNLEAPPDADGILRAEWVLRMLKDVSIRTRV